MRRCPVHCPVNLVLGLVAGLLMPPSPQRQDLVKVPGRSALLVNLLAVWRLVVRRLAGSLALQMQPPRLKRLVRRPLVRVLLVAQQVLGQQVQGLARRA